MQTIERRGALIGWRVAEWVDGPTRASLLARGDGRLTETGFWEMTCTESESEGRGKPGVENMSCHGLARERKGETDDRKEKEIRNNVAGRTGIPEEEFMTCSDDANSE